MNKITNEIRESTHPERVAINWWERPSIIVVPVIFVGAVDLVKAVQRNDWVGAVWVAVIFFFVCPALIFVRSRLRALLRGKLWDLAYWLLAVAILGPLFWLFARHP